MGLGRGEHCWIVAAGKEAFVVLFATGAPVHASDVLGSLRQRRGPLQASGAVAPLA